MQFNESFWVALATALCLLLLIKYIKKPLGEFFHDRAKEIEQKIGEAENLQARSEALLTDYKIMYEDIDKAIQDISNEAEKEAAYIKEKNLNDLEKHLALKKEHALKQIEVKSASLIKKLKRKAVRLSFATAIQLIKKHNYSKTNSTLIKNALAEFSKN